jgi:hypothetical protein
VLRGRSCWRAKEIFSGAGCGGGEDASGEVMVLMGTKAVPEEQERSGSLVSHLMSVFLPLIQALHVGGGY